MNIACEVHSKLPIVDANRRAVGGVLEVINSILFDVCNDKIMTI